jgi:Pyruvate/2-oxoacid:ferredoxin oxidoreductase delta subunit
MRCGIGWNYDIPRETLGQHRFNQHVLIVEEQHGGGCGLCCYACLLSCVVAVVLSWCLVVVGQL